MQQKVDPKGSAFCVQTKENMELEIGFGSKSETELSFPTSTNLGTLTEDQMRQYLDEFKTGDFRKAAFIWELQIERDEAVAVCVSKRKKAVARHDWQVVALDGSAEATAQRNILLDFFRTIQVRGLVGYNNISGVNGLLHHLMDAIGYKYAVSRVALDVVDGKVQGYINTIPLWCIVAEKNELYFRPYNSNQNRKISLKDHLVVVGEGIMESCCILSIRRFQTLAKWHDYTVGLGIPGVVGICDGLEGSAEWEALARQVESFASGENVVISSVDKIENVTRLAIGGTNAFSSYYDELRRSITTAWRGGDLSTRSEKYSMGATLQAVELNLIELDDAQMLSDAINSQLVPMVLAALGKTEIKAEFRIQDTARSEIDKDLSIDKFLYNVGVSQSKSDVLVRYHRSNPTSEQDAFPVRLGNLESEL